MKTLGEFFEWSLTLCSNQKWNKILFYLTVYAEDIRWTDISTRSEYVVDIWVVKGQSENADQSGNILKSTFGAARWINKQDDYTECMRSITAMVT